jgi:hypothetical protein
MIRLAEGLADEDQVREMWDGTRARSGCPSLQLRMHLLCDLRDGNGEHLPQLRRQITASGEGVSGTWQLEPTW